MTDRRKQQMREAERRWRAKNPDYNREYLQRRKERNPEYQPRWRERKTCIILGVRVRVRP